MNKLTWTAAFLLVGSVVVGPALERSRTAQALTATSPTTTPALSILNSIDPAMLEVRANEELGRNNYLVALPMFQKLAERYRDNPDKLGVIQENIRVCQKNLADKIAAEKAKAATRAAIPMGDEDRVPHPAPKAGKILDLDIRELGNFDYDVRNGGIPADVLRLNGATLRTHGFMLPLNAADGITEFALVPNLFNCCPFGQAPQIQHTISVHCPKGKALSYFPDEVVVQGKLTVRENKDSDGFILSIFEMEATSVRPAPQ